MSLSSAHVSSARVVRVLACSIVLVAIGGCATGSPAMYEQQGPRSFSGVQITPTPTGGFSMRILSGMVGNGQPLYIVDGKRVMVEQSRGIDWFQPQDILRIQVLKAPSETTVYGSEGVNGVILITTKQSMRRRATSWQRYGARSIFSHESARANFSRHQPDLERVAATLVD
jgi:TonB-dependent SusC/RagA subfamily outer membrane receptor